MELTILFCSFAIASLIGLLKSIIVMPSWLDPVFIVVVAVYILVQLYVLFRLFLYMCKERVNVIYGIVGFIVGMVVFFLSKKYSKQLPEESLSLLSIEGGLAILAIMIVLFSTYILISSLFKFVMKK